MLKELVTTLNGVGKKTAENLSLMDIFTIEDLLFHFPSRYQISEVKDIELLRHEEEATIVGEIVQAPKVQFYGRKKSTMRFAVQIEGVVVKAIMFNRAFAQKHLALGKTVTLTGKWDQHRLSITVQYYKMGQPVASTSIQPFYATKGNISNAKFKTLITQSLPKAVKEIEEILPATYLESYVIPNRQAAVSTLHHPESREHLKHAKRRFVYEELFIFQLRMQNLKYIHKKEKGGVVQNFNAKFVNTFIDALPYRLTDGQNQALEEIFSDMSEPIQMSRLLQGDVGSGKTAVAMIALYASTTAGFQGAMMVPTEILAEQHYYALMEVFKNTSLNIDLLTSSIKGKKRKEILEGLEKGKIDILLGTHSLIQGEVLFKQLGLVIIDEQHRFGVKQRKALREKGYQPDVLYMTATPIPRTLAITAFGDMDVSVIKEMPMGRKPIETYWVRDDMEERIMSFIEKHVCQGDQAYIVSPLIEESEAFDYQNAIDLHESLSRFFPQEMRLGLLHGRMKQEEKEAVMQAFSRNDIQILVSTTVIEVGVNVPNATVMVIYDAERFGLSQLHQLRGRIGRGHKQSYCILIANPKTEVGKERMRIMQETLDGFELSEADLKLRGPGDFFGAKQSGLPEFKVADIVHDYRALEVARDDAAKIIQNGSFYHEAQYKQLRNMIMDEENSHHFD